MVLAFVFGAEELFAFVDAWFDCPFAFLPVGRADFAVLFEELEGLDHSESFVDRAPQGQIVDDLVADDPILVDQEQASQGDGVSDEYVVVSGDLFIQIGDQGVLDRSDAPLVTRDVSPGQVGKVAIDRHADDFDTQVVELFGTLGEGDDFGGADESKVEGIEEQQDVFAFELAEAQFGERSILEDSFGGEIGCLFGDQNGHSAVLLWETGGNENWDWLDVSG